MNIFREDVLADHLVRRAAMNLPEPVFMGWKHFLNELNTFVNAHVRKQPGDPVQFIVFQGEPTEEEAILHFYLSEAQERYGFDPQKMLSAARYFIGEMGPDIVAEGQDPEDPPNWLMKLNNLQVYEQPEGHRNIKNTWMKNALKNGTAIDVNMVGMKTSDPGVYKLTEFTEGVNYVDAETEQFIQSIGKDRDTGEILASLDTRFYQDPEYQDEYECIYLH